MLSGSPFWTKKALLSPAKAKETLSVFKALIASTTNWTLKLISNLSPSKVACCKTYLDVPIEEDLAETSTCPFSHNNLTINCFSTETIVTLSIAFIKFLESTDKR